MTKNFAEFFAGAGIVRMGLEQAGWNCVFANDHDTKKERIYCDNFGPDEFVLGDINRITAKDIPDITLATASFPCTDLSLAGGRKGLAGKESGAFYPFANLLKKMGRCRPSMILLENVPGLLTSNGGKDIQALVKTLNDIGYALDLFIGDARWFTPQSRPRLFIIGVKGRGVLASRSFYDARDPRLKSPALDRLIEKSSKASYRFLPIPPPPTNVVGGIKEIIETNGAVSWWPGERVEKLLGQMSEKHLTQTLAGKDGKRNTYATVFKRVRNGATRAEARFDQIAGCLRPPRGGASKQILLKAGKGKVMARYLTAREYCRLQGAPDDFRLPKNENAGLFALGDAVCAPLITWIADNVLNEAG